MVGKNTRRSFHLLVGATLTIATSIVGSQLTSSLTGERSWWLRLGWLVAGIALTFLYLRWQLRSQEESPEAIKERVSQLEPELRKQVQARSYGARRQLIEAPLRELDLDITPRLGWVRDPRLIEPEPLPEEKVADDIVAAFESSKRRMLIVGEPGSGKTIAAYSLIEYLDNTEGDQRIPLLVNLSAWEAQDAFDGFLVDYLCSSVGYQVRERAVASAFFDSNRYNLILDGLDEIPLRLRAHFSERLDTFVQGLPGEVGVVVTCRTQEYEEMLASHRTGLGLVQAVEILPLGSEQLDSALVELAKIDKDWETFLSQRDLEASQRARGVLSNPLFLNLAVAGRLSPGQLLECDDEQEVRDLVLESYLDRTLSDQKQYEAEDARRYLSWIARFLNGMELSPFGLKTSDHTIFDLADLTPPDPPRRYWLFGALLCGLVMGGVSGPLGAPAFWLNTFLKADAGERVSVLEGFLGFVLIFVLAFGLVFGLGFGLGWGPFKRSAVSTRLILVWPSTRRKLLNFLRRAGRGLVWGLMYGLLLALLLAPLFALTFASKKPVFGLLFGLVFGMVLGLVFGLVFAFVFGLLQSQSVLITSRTPKEAHSRSLIAALTWLLAGLVGGLVLVLLQILPRTGLDFGLFLGVAVGLILALRNGGWFVVLQQSAHRSLRQSSKLPPRPYEFMEWGIERQIFRRVGGGVRFRHNLIQQHLANASEGAR